MRTVQIGRKKYYAVDGAVGTFLGIRKSKKIQVPSLVVIGYYEEPLAIEPFEWFAIYVPEGAEVRKTEEGHTYHRDEWYLITTSDGEKYGFLVERMAIDRAWAVAPEIAEKKILKTAYY